MGLEGLVKKLANKAIPEPSLPPAEQTCPSNDEPITRRQLFQSRYNYGPNFGSLFVLEKWISHGLFEKGGCDPGLSSELDAVSAFVKKHGVDDARTSWEEHWKSWISNDDWQWLKNHGVTAVRVPIGFWMVNNGAFCSGTPFAKYHNVYAGAWDIFKDSIVKKANSYDIGVLVDVHGLPGGANGEDHSGTSAHETKLWSSSKYESIALDVYEFISKDLKSFDNICGLQLVNEAIYSTDSTQKNFYTKAIKRIRDHNTDIPIVISDGWDLNKWMDFVKHQESKLKGQPTGIVIDTHVYRCFSDSDKRKPPRQIIDEINHALPRDDDVDIMVGEYSCVLDSQTWSRAGGACDRKWSVSQYGNTQSRHFYERAKAGNYFWTYKFQVGSGGEWGFREMTEKRAICNCGVAQYKELSEDELKSTYEHASASALNNHSNYWKQQDPNRDWQDWRFADGFLQGWKDARAFDKFNHSELGRLAAWSICRLLQNCAAKGSHGDALWVYTHGFNRGNEAYLRATRS